MTPARTPEYLKTLGGLTDPNAFIASGERFRDILLHAKDLRDRYAALQMFYDLDELDGLVDSIIQQDYQ